MTLLFSPYLSVPVFFFRKYPSLIEVFGYVFHFSGLICGPTFFFREYMEFISGENYLHKDQEVIQVRYKHLWITLLIYVFQGMIEEIQTAGMLLLILWLKYQLIKI